MTYSIPNKHSNMLKVLLWMCLSIASARTETRVFDLPSMTMMLTARKANNSDKDVFQQRVTRTVQDHLIDFYQDKLYSHNYASNVTINRVNLNAFYDWRETDPATEDNEWMRTYGILGSYNCQLKITLEFEEHAGPHLTQSQMEIFFMEAFQQGNYWALAKQFLDDEVLEGVNDVKITVLSDGYVEAGTKAKEESFTEIDAKTEAGWTEAIKTGILFAIFFCVVLVVLWMYVFHSLLKKAGDDEYVKDDDSEACVTEENSADHDYISDLDEDSWMDNWAKAVTSIPLRGTSRKRSPKNRHMRAIHPMSDQVPSLDCIQEGFDEDASVSSYKSRSSVGSAQSYKSKSSLLRTDHSGEGTVGIMTWQRIKWLGGIQEEDAEPLNIIRARQEPQEPEGIIPNRAEV